MSYSALHMENNLQTNINPTNKIQHVRFQVEKADFSTLVSTQSINERGMNFFIIKNKKERCNFVIR